MDCDRGDSAGARAQLGSDAEPVTAYAPAEPVTGTSESAAFDALRAIANADRPVILRDLGERWVPQLSSKKPGLIANGMTWNNSSTLAEHLDLRLRFPYVKLMWSCEWSVFNFSNFWVTAAGATFRTPPAPTGGVIRTASTPNTVSRSSSALRIRSRAVRRVGVMQARVPLRAYAAEVASSCRGNSAFSCEQ